MLPVNQDPTRLFLLHEKVLTALETQLDSDVPSPKAIELAMRFLKDNNIALDLTADKPNRESLKARMAVIPRLSDDELRLG